MRPPKEETAEGGAGCWALAAVLARVKVEGVAREWLLLEEGEGGWWVGLGPRGGSSTIERVSSWKALRRFLTLWRGTKKEEDRWSEDGSARLELGKRWRPRRAERRKGLQILFDVYDLLDALLLPRDAVIFLAFRSISSTFAFRGVRTDPGRLLILSSGELRAEDGGRKEVARLGAGQLGGEGRVGVKRGGGLVLSFWLGEKKRAKEWEEDQLKRLVRLQKIRERRAMLMRRTEVRTDGVLDVPWVEGWSPGVPDDDPSKAHIDSSSPFLSFHPSLHALWAKGETFEAHAAFPAVARQLGGGWRGEGGAGSGYSKIVGRARLSDTVQRKEGNWEQDDGRTDRSPESDRVDDGGVDRSWAEPTARV
jgi:hypothetical protein